jgi:sirohydrochlorin ferrochelatase
VPATLLVAAHGTRSPAGSATTRALVSAVSAARPGVPVSLGFLDVASPSLARALDTLPGDVIVVPLLLSAGYHVLTDIPAVVSGRPHVQVARHLGPDPAVIDAVAQRLADARAARPAATTVLAAIESSVPSARDEVEHAAALLGARLGRPVSVLWLSAATDAVPPSTEVAVYLLAEGGFLDSLRSTPAGAGVVAEPVGVHPAVVELVWRRYDEVARAVK